jgi:hypothetical protein
MIGSSPHKATHVPGRAPFANGAKQKVRSGQSAVTAHPIELVKIVLEPQTLPPPLSVLQGHACGNPTKGSRGQSASVVQVTGGGVDGTHSPSVQTSPGAQHAVPHSPALLPFGPQSKHGPVPCAASLTHFPRAGPGGSP